MTPNKIGIHIIETSTSKAIKMILFRLFLRINPTIPVIAPARNIKTLNQSVSIPKSPYIGITNGNVTIPTPIMIKDAVISLPNLFIILFISN